MEVENRILKYIHLQMNEAEKQDFEKEINANPELKSEVDFWQNYILAEKLYGKDGFKQKIAQATEALKKKGAFKKAEQEYEKQRKVNRLRILMATAACFFLFCFFYIWIIYLPNEKRIKEFSQIAQKTVKQQPPIKFEHTQAFIPLTDGFISPEHKTNLKKILEIGHCDSIKIAMSENPTSEGILFFYYTGCGYIENEELSLLKLAELANSQNPNLRLYSRYYLALFYLIKEKNEDQAFAYLREIAKQNNILELQNAAQEVLGSLEKI